MVVVAGEDGGPAVDDFNNLVGDLADEGAVVGDEAEGALIVAQGVGEDFAGSDVQVVGGFVHEQQVAGLEQQLGQGDPRLFAAGQHRDGFAHVVAGEEEAAQGGAQVLFRLGRGGLLQLLDDGVGGVEQFQNVLGVVGGNHIVAQPPFAGVKGEDAGQQLEQGGLAGAVGADQGHPVAALQGQVQALIDYLIAVPLADVGQGDDFGAAAGRRGKGVVDFPGSAGQLDRLNLSPTA